MSAWAASTDFVNRQLRRIWRSLDSDSLATLIIAVVNSRKDYCSSVLAGAPRTVMDKLQPVLNAATHVTTWHSALVRYCTTNCIGSTFRTGLFPSWQWQFTCVWTTAHHRICRSTASRSPVLTGGGICVPPTVTYLPYRVSASTLMAIGRSQLLARWPGTHSRILSWLQRAAQTVLDAYLECTCLRLTSASSALGVLTDYALYKPTHSLTH